jgi:DNA-directed RNA polymerase subunit RPC12/RpoP
MPSVVQTFLYLNDAEVARSALASTGIEAWLENTHLVAMNALYANAVGGLRLVVADEDLAAARTALADLRDSAATSDMTFVAPSPAIIQSPAETRCPACGSLEVTEFQRLKIFAIIGLLLMGIGFAIDERDLFALATAIAGGVLLMTPSHQCRSCGERFTPPPKPRPEPVVTEEQETPDRPCPRCASPETQPIGYRRFKAASILINPMALAFLVVWPFLPRMQCHTCGNRW